MGLCPWSMSRLDVNNLRYGKCAKDGLRRELRDWTYGPQLCGVCVVQLSWSPLRVEGCFKVGLNDDTHSKRVQVEEGQGWRA